MKLWKVQKFFSDVVYDMRSRNLLLVAILLIVAIIADSDHDQARGIELGVLTVVQPAALTASSSTPRTSRPCSPTARPGSATTSGG